MADDGMLLNFAISSEPWQAKPVFKGGRWKDRLTAKLGARYGQNKRLQVEQQTSTQTRTPPTSEDAEFAEPRAAKRQRTDNSNHTVLNSGHRTQTASSREERIQQLKSGPREVISSLFSFNPDSTTQKPEQDVEDDQPVQPSNAPLSSELETFTSLGLSTSVAAHLFNKMQIKAPTAIQRQAVTQLVEEDSDAFIQAETGSGKTLAYLLPIVQRVIQMSETMKKGPGGSAGLGRVSGLFAIILAPTRELSKQISAVLESLLGCAHWIVAGTVIGGEKKKSEKARLRKGLNILVATPGRLADHLNNTDALDVSNVRWLVLDEGDRLMELGFEQDIQRIVSILNLRMKKERTGEMAALPLPDKRTTILCSATMKMDVLKLGEISLKNAAHLVAEGENDDKGEQKEGEENAFSAPAQLKQSYATVPAKQRLVTLVAVLRRAFARKGSVTKAIVFVSCADSVDYHFKLMTRPEDSADKHAEDDIDVKEARTSANTSTRTSKGTGSNKIPQGLTLPEIETSAPAPAFSSDSNAVTLHRLHGSLPQQIRTSTLKAFTTSQTPAILICTDVASRGLDLPNIDLVIEYDPPFSKDDHLHRIGRTARAGREGRAMIFLQPGCEEGYVEILNQGRRDGGRGVARHDADELLQKGFGAQTGVVGAKEWEERATAWQLEAERWVLASPKALEMARRAFQSNVRAYATHVAAERAMFDIKELHLGHLAKAFALRDKPSGMKVPGLRPGKFETAKNQQSRAKAAGKKSSDKRATGGRSDAMEDVSQATDVEVAARRMKAKMKAMGGGASEFNLG